jgi:hypothetical protein
MKTIMIVLGSIVCFLIIELLVGTLIGYSIDKAEQQNKTYQKCLSNHGSDWGCDSCFHAVYGYYLEE